MYGVRAAFGSASRWRVQRATSAQHSSAKQPFRAPNSVTRAFGIHSQKLQTIQTKPQSAKGLHGRKESATSGNVR